MPSDVLGSEVAKALLEGDDRRERLTANIFVPKDDAPGLCLLEQALEMVVDARPVTTKIHEAIKTGSVEKAPVETLVERALKAEVISPNEKRALDAASAARLKAVQVDWFDAENYQLLR